MLQNIATRSLAALSLVLTVAGGSARAGDATFGKGATFNTDVGLNLVVSDDKKAFTAIFGGLEAVIDGPSAAPVATRMFSFSLPLSGADPGQEIPFFVSGFSASEKGASAHLMFSVNDQSMVSYFPAGAQASFVQELKYKATDAAEARITVFLLADRDSKSKAAVHLNVTAIDTDIAKHKR